MPKDEDDFTGKVATVTGWGRLKYGTTFLSIYFYYPIGDFFFYKILRFLLEKLKEKDTNFMLKVNEYPSI